MSEQTKFRRFPVFSCGLVCYCFCCCCFKLAWKWFIFESNVDIFTTDQNFQFRRALIYTRDHLLSDCQLLIKIKVLKKWILISFKKADLKLVAHWALTPQNGQTHSNHSTANWRRIVWACLTILWGWHLKSDAHV